MFFLFLKHKKMLDLVEFLIKEIDLVKNEKKTIPIEEIEKFNNEIRLKCMHNELKPFLFYIYTGYYYNLYFESTWSKKSENILKLSFSEVIEQLEKKDPFFSIDDLFIRICLLVHLPELANPHDLDFFKDFDDLKLIHYEVSGNSSEASYECVSILRIFYDNYVNSHKIHPTLDVYDKKNKESLLKQISFYETEFLIEEFKSYVIQNVLLTSNQIDSYKFVFLKKTKEEVDYFAILQYFYRDKEVNLYEIVAEHIATASETYINFIDQFLEKQEEK